LVNPMDGGCGRKMPSTGNVKKAHVGERGGRGGGPIFPSKRERTNQKRRRGKEKKRRLCGGGEKGGVPQTHFPRKFGKGVTYR